MPSPAPSRILFSQSSDVIDDETPKAYQWILRSDKREGKEMETLWTGNGSAVLLVE